MRRSSIALVLLVGACGPSPGDPSAESNGAGSSGAPMSDETSSGIDPDTTSESSSSAESSTTEAPDDELPPDAAGNWMCTGWEDPIYLRLVPGDDMPWAGTACGPDASLGHPREWTGNCGELGFGHPNGTGTQAYWIFTLEYDELGGPALFFDLGVDYVAESDTLEGFLLLDDPPSGFIPETCERDAKK
ncbi:MAG TPA: hypothetical protein VFG69_04155 [Nannocystaceae bacterium]|nr:hypothetical protein [Nannocystaceae bacterium]